MAQDIKQVQARLAILQRKIDKAVQEDTINRLWREYYTLLKVEAKLLGGKRV